MNEQEKRDSQDLTAVLKDLSKEDRIHVQGVIAGLRLARSLSNPDSRSGKAEQKKHLA